MNQPAMDELKATTELPSKADLHLLRKIWHMGCGGFVLSLYYLRPDIEFRVWGQSILILALMGFSIEFLRLKNFRLNQFIMKLFSPFLRDNEKNSLSGFPFYALGCAVSIFAYEEKIAILSILFLVVSDPVSSLFGIIYGKDKILREKSLQGSLAGFGVCYFLTLFYSLAHTEASLSLFLFSLLAGLIGSVSELLSIYIDDNFTIPVFSGLGITLLNKVFLIF